MRVDVQSLDCDFFVFSDEEYEKLVFDGRTHTSIASLPGMAERVELTVLETTVSASIGTPSTAGGGSALDPFPSTISRRRS